MKQAGKARIFLAENRGSHENELFRSLDTFTSGKNITTTTAPMGKLYSFSDDTLAAGASFKVKAEENSFLLLLPVVGAVTVRKEDESDGLAIGAGELFVTEINEGTSINIHNPYEEDLVNYLQVWIRKENDKSCQHECFFDLNKNYNTLATIFSEANNSFDVTIGKFAGRKESEVELKPNEYVFVFVIEGAFEVNGRLLHARDSLSLWETTYLEAEALSNNAILLTINFYG